MAECYLIGENEPTLREQRGRSARRDVGPYGRQLLDNGPFARHENSGGRATARYSVWALGTSRAVSSVPSS